MFSAFLIYLVDVDTIKIKDTHINTTANKWVVVPILCHSMHTFISQ